MLKRDGFMPLLKTIVTLALSLGVTLQSSGCSEQQPTLKSLPEELRVVIADQSRFLDPDNPLRSTGVGTELDGPAGLDGCWGSVESESIDDGIYREAQTLRIDVEKGTVDSSLYQGVDGVPFPQFTRPIVRTFHESLESTEDGALIRTIDQVLFAGVDSRGRLVYDALADFGAFLDEGSRYSRSFTMEGDHLLVSDTIPEGDVDLFVRFDCP